MSQKKRRLERRAAQPAAGRPEGGAGPAPASRNWPAAVTLAGVAAILLLTLAAFSPVLDNGFTNWDDTGYVTNNPYIRSLDGENVRALFSPSVTFVGNYQPLTMLTYALNYRGYALMPAAYHATSLLLHLLNTGLVFAFFLLLTRRVEVAAIVSLFFGIHPMHVESVAWASARKDVLYVFFFLLALISYLAYLRPELSPRRRAGFYALTALCFVASLLSKSAAVVLPIVLLLIDYLRRRPLGARMLVEKLPLFALSLVFGLIAIRSQTAASAIGDLSGYTWLQRIALPCYGVLMYLVKLLVPTDLSALYPYPRAVGGLPPFYVAAPFILLALAALVAWSSRRTRVVVFGAAFFLVCLALVLQVVNVGGAIIADRYTYLAYLGPLFIVGIAYAALLDRTEPRFAKWKRVATAALAIYAVLFAYGTWRRAQVWKDSYTLWTDVIQQFPDSAVLGYNSRGEFLKDRARYDEAIADFDRAIAILPNYVDPYNNRGNLYFALRNDERAIADYTRALELDPAYVKAYANRGAAFVRAGKHEAALRDFARAVEVDPSYPVTYLNRAQFYCDVEQFESAIADLDRYVELDPENPQAWYARGIAKRGLKQHEASLADFARAIALLPADGQLRFSRARSLEALGRWDEALEDVRLAARLGAPVTPEYIARLEHSRALGGDDEALARLRAAVEREPDERAHRSELAKRLVARNELAEAETVLRGAVTRWPCESGLRADLANVVMRTRGPAEQVQVLAEFVASCKAPPEIVNDLAYLLATVRDPGTRDAVRALELAEQAVAAYGEHPMVLDTLAVAYAANGRFDEAVDVSQRAVREAERLRLPDDEQKTLQHHHAALAAGNAVQQ